MATRATYLIKEMHPYGDVEQWFYIHHDGYPEGAAEYFRQMLINFDLLKMDMPTGEEQLWWKKGKAVIAFGLHTLAEFTKDEHGDTEYHYEVQYCHTIGIWSISAKHISRWNEDKTIKISIIFDGLLSEFIKQYHPEGKNGQMANGNN